MVARGGGPPAAQRVPVPARVRVYVSEPPVQPGLVRALPPREGMGQRPAEPVGGPVPVLQLLVGAAYGFHRAARRIRVVRGPSGMQRGPVAVEGLLGPPGRGVQVGQVEQRGGLLPVQPAPLRHVQDQPVQPVQLGRGLGGAAVLREGPYEGGHQPAGQGVQLAVGDGEGGRGRQRGQPGVEPGGGGPPVGEAQGPRQPLQLLPYVQAVVLALGHGPAGVQEPYGALQHPGPRELDLGGALLGLQQGLELGHEAAGQQEQALGGVPQQAEPGEVVERGLGRGHGAARQGGGGVRVDDVEAGASGSSRRVRWAGCGRDS